MKQITWIVMGYLTLFAAVQAASFDCVKSTSNTELLVCRDTELSRLDDDLNKSYQQLLASGTDKQNLIIEQRQWLRDVRNACMNSACLKSVYKSRISELQTSSPQVVKEEKIVPFKVEMPSVCGFPGAVFPEDTVVMAAGAVGGKELDFQIDQSGHWATQIDVAVNYPDKPVALMLGASDPTIWNIGWTEGTRIVAVFASGDLRQRVSGLAKDTPQLFSTHNDKDPCSDSGFAYKNFGNSEFSVDFGYGQKTDAEQATPVEKKLAEILFAHPISRIFGVLEGRVVIGNPLAPGQPLITSSATTPKSFYDSTAPLAGEAGLRSAMKRGVIRRATLNDAKKWIKALKKKYALQHLPPPDIPPDLYNAYVVLKQFTYPPGLYGGLSATFYIPEGVPQPAGNYGHSKIYDLNSISLECNGGSACGQAITDGWIGSGSTEQITTINGGSGMAVIYKQSLEAESKTKPDGSSSKKYSAKQSNTKVGSRSVPMGADETQDQTNLPGVPFARSAFAPSQIKLHAIGVYEGPHHFGGMPVEDPSSSTINVRVHAIRSPVVLALYNYESVLWNIIADDGVVIKEIVLSSYNASKVSGIDNKIVKVTRQDMGIVYDNSTAQSAAPKLMAYTGLDVGTFQTSYEGTEFSVGP